MKETGGSLSLRLGGPGCCPLVRRIRFDGVAVSACRHFFGNDGAMKSNTLQGMSVAKSVLAADDLKVFKDWLQLQLVILKDQRPRDVLAI